MEYRKIGNLEVSLIGLGCNNFGTTFGTPVDLRGTRLVVDAAIDKGITLLDTADIYGDSELFLGEVLKGRTEKVVIASKFGGRMGSDERSGASARWIMQAVDDSLKRLGVETIDLYQLHYPDSETALEETMGALSVLIEQGKVREIGCCNHSPVQIDEAAETTARLGFAPFVSAQNELNILRSRAIEDVLPACERNGMGLLPYSPLANGLLTGKYQRGLTPDSGTRLGHMSEEVQGRLLTGKTFDRLTALGAFAKERGRSILELAFAWLLAYPAVSSVIAGATSPEQVSANAGATAWRLTIDERQQVRELVTSAAA